MQAFIRMLRAKGAVGFYYRHYHLLQSSRLVLFKPHGLFRLLPYDVRYKP